MEPPLHQPIGALMRPTFTVDAQDSLEMAARRLRENGGILLPVTQDDVFSGVVTEAAMAGALAEAVDLDSPVAEFARGAITAHPSITGAEALRRFQELGPPALVVIDNDGRVLGILSPSDLFRKSAIPPRPPVVGGMATPFGVYLTTGGIGAGVGHLALLSTGALLFSLFLVSTVAALAASSWLAKEGFGPDLLAAFEGGVPFLLFLAGMRLLPLSGIHAAEHKVVHAIERGEELSPRIVRRMPRVHPRCGTNLAVGAAIFMSLGSLPVLEIGELRLLVAGVATLALWRPLGNLMQRFVTTKPPNEGQLAMGIRSGNELLAKYAANPSPPSGFLRRIYYSGMLHVIGGSLLAFGLAQLAIWLFHIPVEL